MIVTVIAAGGLLYLYNFAGQVSLLVPHDDRFETTGFFTITGGNKEHCSHPVIRDGVLYIRHDSFLFAFQI